MKNIYVLFIYAIVLASLIALVGTVSDLVAEAVFFGERRDNIFTAFLRMFVIQFFLVSMAYNLVKLFNKRFSWTRKPLSRISVEVGFVILFASILVLVARFGAQTFRPVLLEGDLGRFLMMVSMSSFMMGLLAFSFVEVWFRTKENMRLESNIAQLEHKITESQYQALRQQLNPHFLFNSLNTLASLVYIDAEKADAFIQEFAEVYRYVLRLTNEPTVSVQQELDFLNSYLFLQRIRFNDNLHFDDQLEDFLLQGRIPPLTLQLLIENAIKHNEVSPDHPLRITLENDGWTLLVRNNVKLRKDQIHSNGYGWKNYGG